MGHELSSNLLCSQPYSNWYWPKQKCVLSAWSLQISEYVSIDVEPWLLFFFIFFFNSIYGTKCILHFDPVHTHFLHMYVKEHTLTTDTFYYLKNSGHDSISLFHEIIMGYNL